MASASSSGVQIHGHIAMSTLFDNTPFRSHSGLGLLWKIECNALTPEDWAWAAARVAERYSFREVAGVPQGGIPFERALKPYRNPTANEFLVVDDVLTTGNSLRYVMGCVPDSLGVVLFARGPLPPQVEAIFTYWPSSHD